MTFSTVGQAFQAVLDEHPEVLAIGELHAPRGAPARLTTMHRFRTSLLPLLRGKRGFLVLETWQPNTSCGNVQRHVVKQIRRKISRKQSEKTTSELVQLVQSARAMGLMPRILHPTCEDYRSMRDNRGRFDPAAMLTLVGRLLGEETQRAWEQLFGRSDGVEPAGSLVVVYGGAVHNDANPKGHRTRYSFGVQMAKRLRDRYVELDLIVPEFADEMEDLLTTEPWHACYDEASSSGKPVSFHGKRGSWTILFPRLGSRQATHPNRKATHQDPTTSARAVNPKAP